MNKGGGSCYELEEIRKIRKLCQKHSLFLHLDGARVFNACIAKGYSTQEIGQEFDSISICFSKGLGAPVGSVLVGSEAFIHEARRVRKVLGGGMRQAGILASAAFYALNNHVDRLTEDHRRAKEMGDVLKQCDWIQFLYPIETNIIIFEVVSPFSGAQIIEQLSALGIRCAGFGKMHVRFVFHLDISEEQHQHAMTVIQNFQPQ
jgi:threonine aldolase